MFLINHTACISPLCTRKKGCGERERERERERFLFTAHTERNRERKDNRARPHFPNLSVQVIGYSYFRQFFHLQCRAYKRFPFVAFPMHHRNGKELKLFHTVIFGYCDNATAIPTNMFQGSFTSSQLV